MRQIPSILWWFIALLISTQVHAEELLDKVRDSGRLVVGVKVDYPPWGMLNDSGGNSGFEADLAQQIAEAIGQDSDEVAVEFKTVSSANRFRKLNDKDVDILIATVGDTIQRRHQVNMVQPHYFKSGVQVLMKKKTVLYISGLT
ncbi:transporter substrate-binding domain-containing protein [Marinomonas sp. A3A]|uniref:transporter substrate-binding domain-containing protein n=1 Tax=Marinomonas sp. A3A TaxID=2065312 RepID=UPI001BB425B3|nr:transporter substrate-binding domain-containing protein [Marinomonas sp. A3A]